VKAVSLWQPWAYLWVSGIKIHETRSWPTSHRGWIAVHAARKHADVPAEVEDIMASIFGHTWRSCLEYGTVVGAVRITDCLPTEQVYPRRPSILNDARDYMCGDFTPGRFAWRSASVYKCIAPHEPIIGRQRIFNVPDEVFPNL
jgi:hypothetical protein